MGFPWLAIAAGAKVGSALFGAFSTKSAGKDAKELGELNAKYIQAETAEQARRLRFEQDRTTGTTKATFAASGLRSGDKTRGGSQQAYLDTLKRVQKSELDWIYKSGRSRADIARRGGQAEGSRLKAQSIGMFGTALTGAATLGYNIQAGTSGYS